MKTVLAYLYYTLLRFLLSLRYRLKTKGLETLTKENLARPGGILFLANHPAEIDPCILLRIFWPKFHFHPVAIDYLFRRPIVRYLLDFIEALPVPNFENSSNSFKVHQIDQTYEKIFAYLDKKENLLIYPAGGLKSTGKEVLGGASGVHYILQKRPEINVVLVRTTGLWGSSFSRALTGKSPNIMPVLWHGLKVLIKNGFFFTPKREVTVECMPAPADFPWRGDRLELNRYLEQWYNRPSPEPLYLVSYSLWKKDLPTPFEPPKEEKIAFVNVPEEIQVKVIQEITTLTKVSADKIIASSTLSSDLGLDSLDLSQLVVMLKEEFGVSGVQSSDLLTVGTVFLYAARLKKGRSEEEESGVEGDRWTNYKERPHALYPEGETIPEVFLKTCDRMGHHPACVDKISGEISYKQLKLGVILLAQAIKKMPGERIGIMMPASIAVNAAIVATMLAKKVPVMVNWTLGERNLRSIIEQSGIQTTLSSWSFLDRLDNVDLNGLDSQIILLEELRRGFTLWQKLKAFLSAHKNTQALLKSFGSHDTTREDVAAILFTSGTESIPKGVPLSHANIIENQRGAYAYVDVDNRDVLLGALPPFHSFGFSVTGLLPLLAGLRVAYSPNPTDGRRMALAIDRWHVTVLCIAPTFLKNLLRVSSESQLRSLRLVVAGAEKAGAEIFERMQQLNPNTRVVEGYGITECGPILTLNPPAKPSKGVGCPLPHIELLVVNPETLERLQQEERGLILARGPNVFSGYLDQKLPSPFVNVEGKTWYQTGDLGFIDSQGYLTLSGRLKRFIKIGGEMISLGAVEDALIQSAKQRGWKIDPDTPSLAVCAREQAGKKSEMHLFTTFEATTDEVNQVLRESGMSNLIKIRSVNKLSFIPLLGTGKIDYRALSDFLNNI